MDNNLILLHEETINMLRTAQEMPYLSTFLAQQAFGACTMFIRLFPDTEAIVNKYWSKCLAPAFDRI